jgi:hypothetical protein
VAVLEQVEDDAHRIGAKAVESAERLDRASGLPPHYLFEELDRLGPVGKTEHVADLLAGDALAGAGLDDGLVEQRLGVPHRALGGPGDEGEGLRLDPSAFGLGDGRQIRADHVRLDAAQVEPLTAREYGHRDLTDLRGGKDEFGVRRRLLERFEQRVERVRRKHVHFVDDVDLIAGLGGRITHSIEQLAHVVDLGATGGVDLEDIQMPALDNGAAMPPLGR